MHLIWVLRGRRIANMEALYIITSEPPKMVEKSHYGRMIYERDNMLMEPFRSKKTYSRPAASVKEIKV